MPRGDSHKYISVHMPTGTDNPSVLLLYMGTSALSVIGAHVGR